MAKRRPSGDGMVRKRDDGRWEGRIVVGHRENGTPLFRYIHAKTQNELLDRLHRELELYRDVDLTEDSQMTLAAWLDRWLDEYMVNTVRSGTLASYRMYANSYIKPILGDKTVSQITATDVQKMYTKLKKEGRVHENPERGRALSDAMIRSIHTMFHHAMKAAEQERLTAKNPTEGAVIPKVRHAPKQILNDRELEIFMDAIKGEPLWYDLFYVELTTGLRRGELCGLQWSDFDEVAGTLRICRTVHVERGGKLIAGAPKTDSGNRKIVLPPSTAQLLQERKKSPPSEWIFFDPLKPEEPISPPAVYRKLKEILKKAGLPDVTVHGLRHTFSTHALAGGVDAKTLSSILGHTKASFTLDTYTHVTGDMQKRAAGIVGDFMEEIFGKELEPWRKGEKTEREAST